MHEQPGFNPGGHGVGAIGANSVCIVGCGTVGMATAFALIQSWLIRELVLVGHDDD